MSADVSRAGAKEPQAFDVGTGPLMPDAGIWETGRVDLSVYSSQERFDIEREIFGRIWLNVSEVDEIPNPGDWVVKEVTIRSASIILVRGKDMQIRAFHNMCSHRGMKLVWDEAGHGGKFACPYHAWIYDSNGALVNIPSEACFKHVDKAESGLTPVRCEVWEGFIFINLDAEGTQSLEEFLGPLTQRLQNLPFQNYPYVARIGGMIDCNWKLAIEAQGEAYHISALHSRTVSKMLVTRDNAPMYPLNLEFLGPHRLQSVQRNPDYEGAPGSMVQSFSFMHAQQMVVPETGGEAQQLKDRFDNHPDLNPTRSNMWSNDQIAFYPNMCIHMSLGGWFMHRFWPVAPDKCMWESVYHFEEPKSLRAEMALQYSLAFNRDTLMEDNLALVQQQHVMKSGARKFAQFGDNENLCKHLASVSEAVSNDIGSLAEAAE